ncbi:MAG: type 2 isopentenyl-diphosphate Delta-isomerase [Anaerolineae bacterium]
MEQIPFRKLDHVRINLEEDVQGRGITTEFERYRFVHQAAPDLNLAEIDLSTSLLGKTLRAPLIISSMTGGAESLEQINRTLAEAAQRIGIGMGVGSQRAAIKDPALAYTYQVRSVAPDILLFANLGAVQLNYGYTVDECRRAVEMIEADALILHLNVLQESVQPEGDTNWCGLLDKIADVCRQLDVPVIGKEVGWGISDRTARQLAEAGVAAIDVAGAGGTSWSEVERHRAPTEYLRRVAGAFIDWGIPTAESIQMVQRGAPGRPIIASGGLRDGIDAAKAIALGATATAMASPYLKRAVEGVEAVVEEIEIISQQLRVAMMCVGAGTIEALQNTPHFVRVDYP